jgi:hypothetical protein
MRSLVLFLCLCGAGAAHAAEDVLAAFQQAYAEAIGRYQDEDMAGFLAASETALRHLPNHHGANWNAAVAAARERQPDLAWKHLNTLAEMGLAFPFWTSAHFADYLEREDWQVLRAHTEANMVETGQDTPLFDLGPEPRFIEDVISLDSMWLVSSVHHRGLYRIDDGWRPFMAGMVEWWSPMALVALGDWLIVTHSAVPQGKGVPAHLEGRAGAVAIDWRKEKVVDQVVLDDGKHVLGEAIVVGEEVWMTDSAEGSVISWHPGREWRRELPAGSLPNPQGLAYDPERRRLYLADYFLGLVWMNVDDRRLRPLAGIRPMATVGIDGLYLHGNALIAIQNGIRPLRIVCWTLSDDGRQIIEEAVLAGNRGDWIEPTLGFLDQGDLVFVAGAQWPNYDEQQQPEGPFGPVLVKRLPLTSDACQGTSSSAN